MSAGTTSAHRLALDGDLTIRTIGQAHKTLAFAITEASKICVDLSGAKDADLTLVQLLLSAHRTAQRDGKSLHLSQPLPDTLLSEVVRGGFDRDSFWTTGE